MENYLDDWLARRTYFSQHHHNHHLLILANFHLLSNEWVASRHSSPAIAAVVEGTVEVKQQVDVFAQLLFLPFAVAVLHLHFSEVPGQKTHHLPLSLLQFTTTAAAAEVTITLVERK